MGTWYSTIHALSDLPQPDDVDNLLTPRLPQRSVCRPRSIIHAHLFQPSAPVVLDAPSQAGALQVPLEYALHRHGIQRSIEIQ